MSKPFVAGNVVTFQRTFTGTDNVNPSDAKIAMKGPSGVVVEIADPEVTYTPDNLSITVKGAWAIPATTPWSWWRICYEISGNMAAAKEVWVQVWPRDIPVI